MVREQPTPATAADDGPDADPADVARTIALASLNAAPRTRAQLEQLLEKRGVPADAARACLDRFTELHLIDDGEYARMWVRSRHGLRHLPRRTLRYELLRKGVATNHIEAALELIDDEDEFEAAKALAERKVRLLRNHDAAVRRRRAMGALLRKGFAPEVASRALAEVLADEDEHADWEFDG